MVAMAAILHAALQTPVLTVTRTSSGRVVIGEAVLWSRAQLVISNSLRCGDFGQASNGDGDKREKIMIEGRRGALTGRLMG